MRFCVFCCCRCSYDINSYPVQLSPYPSSSELRHWDWDEWWLSRCLWCNPEGCGQKWRKQPPQKKKKKKNKLKNKARTVQYRDCDGVPLTSVQCHRVPISILWYREYWTIQLKCTLETIQETITVSNHPIHQHGHNNFWYVCLLERVYFDY